MEVPALTFHDSKTRHVSRCPGAPLCSLSGENHGETHGFHPSTASFDQFGGQMSLLVAAGSRCCPTLKHVSFRMDEKS